nr:GNAT family N-acetyltransferase [uncultured Roseateles sp.]
MTEAAARPIPTLQGRHSLLRELRPADAASLQKHADDRAVWRNLFDGFPSPYTLADAQAWCSGGWRHGGHVWGIVVDEAVVGCVGFQAQQGWLRCNAEIGYWIGQPFWRRGITGEALRLVTAWAWAHQPELTRLVAPIFAWNEGSQAVARHAGYLKEAELPQSAIKDGQVIDRVQWACYRPTGST